MEEYNAEFETNRYILFGAREGWSGLPQHRVDGFCSLGSCINRAREVKLPFMLVIDRYYPQIPIYLDSDDEYNEISVL